MRTNAPRYFVVEILLNVVIGGNLLENVKCGGTAAQDSQSEANEGAYPPLPPTTCSAFGLRVIRVGGYTR